MNIHEEFVLCTLTPFLTPFPGSFFREKKVLGQVVASMKGSRSKEDGMLVEKLIERAGAGIILDIQIIVDS